MQQEEHHSRARVEYFTDPQPVNGGGGEHTTYLALQGGGTFFLKGFTTGMYRWRRAAPWRLGVYLWIWYVYIGTEERIRNSGYF